MRILRCAAKARTPVEFGGLAAVEGVASTSRRYMRAFALPRRMTLFFAYSAD